MVKGKKILITGGAGFIGTKLANRLYEENEIFIYDKLERNSIKNTQLLDDSNITLVQGDIMDANHLTSVVHEIKPNIVIHMAAIAGVDNVQKRPIDTMETNLIGTYHILQALKPIMDSVDRFIDFSTSEVFGTFAYNVSESDHMKISPVGEARWTYQVSKLAAEHLVDSYHKVHGLKSVTIRPFNIYGPGQVGAGAIHAFVKNAIQNKTIEVHGDGSQIRAWTYVEDMVDAILLCMVKQEAIGNAFNIGNSRSAISIRMLADFVKQISNSKSEIIFVPAPSVDVELRIPNTEKARQLLGFDAKVDLFEGIENTIDWYRKELAK